MGKSGPLQSWGHPSHRLGDPSRVILERANDWRRALDAEQNPVTRVADPAQMKVTPLAADHYGESRAALLIRPLKLDSLQE